MDILSDVKITGSLTTVGDIKVGNYGSGVINVGEITGSLNNGSLEISGTINTVRTSEIIIGNKLNMAWRSNSTAIFCNVSFGGGNSTLDLTGAKVIGLDVEKNHKITIPSNCSVFWIDSSGCSIVQYDYKKRVPVSSFMQYGDDWKQVQLDISFKKCTTTSGSEVLYALIGSLSQAFSEPKTMEFIVG